MTYGFLSKEFHLFGGFDRVRDDAPVKGRPGELDQPRVLTGGDIGRACAADRWDDSRWCRGGSVAWRLFYLLLRREQSVQLSFDAEHGELVGHDAHAPAGLIAASAVAVSRDLGRRFALIAVIERADSGNRRRNGLADEIVGAFRPIGGDNHPSSRDRVFTQFGQAGRFLSKTKNDYSVGVFCGADNPVCRRFDLPDLTVHVLERLLALHEICMNSNAGSIQDGKHALADRGRSSAI